MDVFKLFCCAVGAIIGGSVYQIGKLKGELDYKEKFMNAFEQAMIAVTKKTEETEEQ